MISYHIRSRDLITVVNEIKAGRLILDAYFQRNLVWREAHKQDFIKTILLGYPFPQIFVSKGTIDIELMQTTSCVVDGQQRLDAIVSFIDGAFAVDGKKYHDLTGSEKSEFLKYEIASIELDIDNNDPVVKDIFQRLNRTANSLTAIEKIASQYAPSLYMLVASHLSGELDFAESDEDSKFRVDPLIDPQFFAWAGTHPVPVFSDLVQNQKIFRTYEVSRKMHLMHVLNIMSTFIVGFFNRNEASRDLLDTYSDSFPEMEDVVSCVESAAETWRDAQFPDGSYWLNKANFFSLIIAIGNVKREGKGIDPKLLRERLDEFAANLPDEYRFAAKEGVNNTAQRETRNKFLAQIIDKII
jgi:Protein of unknown function DUF262